MAKIRPYEQQQFGGSAPGGRQASPADFGAGTADAVADFGATLIRVGQHVDQVRQRTVLSGTTARAAQELQDYSFTLENGSVNQDGTIVAPPDPAQHLKLYDEKAKEIRGRVKSQLGDDRMFGLFDQDFNKVVLRESFGVRKNMIAKQKATALGEFEMTEDTLAEVAGRGDAFSQATAVEQYRMRLQDMVAAGIIGADKAPEREKKFMVMLERASVRESIRTDPDGAILSLLDDKQYTRMNPDERQRWVGIATTEADRRVKARNADEERTRREMERIQRETEATTYRSAIDLSVNGKLTVPWVQQNKDNIAKTDYDNLMRIAAKGGTLVEGQRNRELYGDLRDQVSRGSDVRNEAKRAHARGDISDGQLNTIYNEWETRGADGSGAYKDGVTFIRNALEPSQTNPKLTGFTRARALNDFQEWSQANPNATREDTVGKAREIAGSYHVVAVEESVIGKARPKYVSGVLAPSNVVESKANLSAGLKKLDEERAAGRVSPFDYQYQVRLMNEWVQALKAQEELQAKNNTSGKTGDKKGK